MSRLDRHISVVRNKLALTIFFSAWAWSALCVGAMFWVMVIGQRVLDLQVHHWAIIIYSGIGVSLLAALAWMIIQRPGITFTATTIDKTLGLKEKYSSALYARRVNDPFAAATVLDAEQTAQNVSIYKRFPIRFPRQAIGAGVVFLGAFLTAILLPPMHLFAKAPPVAPKPPQQQTDATRSLIAKNELPKIEEGSKIFKDNTALQKASDDLTNALKTRETDELKAKRSALMALQDYKKAITEELDKNANFQTAQNEKNELQQMQGADDESTPMGKAQNDLKNGDVESAMKDINKAVTGLDKMSQEDQKKTVDQAKQLANALQKLANDPNQQQKLQQQLQQMGANPQQAQQLAQTMQQAAQGNPQAQQQLQQQAQQMQQQMNNGQGPTQQQKQQIQSMMAHAQGMANAQAQAQSMSSSMKSLAQAMQQQQQAQAGQSSQGGQQGAQSSQGQAPGQSGSTGNQSVSQAQQQLQQQMQQMEAIAKDAQAMQAARDAANEGEGDAAGGLAGNGNGGLGEMDPNGVPPDHADQTPNQQMGQGGPGQGGGGLGPGGGKMGIVYTPGHTQQVLDPSADNPTGKILASRYVKASNDSGVSTAGKQDVSASAEKDATDEVDNDHVSREAQQAVKDYFSGLNKADQQ